MGLQFKGILLILVTVVVLALVESGANISPPLYREIPVPIESLERREDLNYRLPNNTRPIHYDVELTTNVHTGEIPFSGKVQIQLEVLEDTRTIVVHARQLSNFVASIKKVASSDKDIDLKYSYDNVTEFLSLTPKNTGDNFLKNTNWVLTIEYTGNLRKDNGGFYLSSYKDSKNATRYLATTQYESTNARHGFPCYDEPARRATFVIKINHNNLYTAISAMPVNSKESRPGYTVFEKTPLMSTYLVAFIVSDFKYTEGTLNGLPQRIFSRPDTKHQHEWALVSGMLLIQRLAEYFDIPFDLPKLDQVAVPDFAAGAMENWGLVTYREELLLFDKEKSTTSTQTQIANIIGHEYTHQWFGNLVAIEWWSYLWLKEGFATLFSYQSVDDAYPEWGVFQMFHASEYQSALSVDAANESRPMTYYIQTPNDISRMYDSISYAKAGCVLHMWQHALPDNVFKLGLNNYLTQNKYSAANEDALFKAIQDAAKAENVPLQGTISNMMKSWTNQGGYPQLKVNRNYTDGSFTVKQVAYYNDVNYNKTKSWWIPFNFVSKSKHSFHDTVATDYLENKLETNVNGSIHKDDWLLLNKQSTGYYRINYDERNWELIIESLKVQPHKIHPRNRAQLMSDANSFIATNELKHNILLNLLTYLKNEDEYAPWSIASSILTNYNKYLSGHKNYRSFQFFLGDLVEQKHDEFGVDDVAAEHHLRKFTRSTLMNLACLAGIDNCLNSTNKKLTAHIEEGNPIEPNLQSQIYCNGLKNSGDKEFHFLYDDLMKSDDQARRQLLISSLGCAQKKEHIEKFIKSSTDSTSNLRVQERPSLLNKCYSRGAVGLMTSIEFLQKDWKAYSNLEPGFTKVNPLETDIIGMAKYVVNAEQQKKLLDLVETVKDHPGLSKTLKVSVEAEIKKNFDWLDKNSDPIMNWVASYHSKSGSSTLTASYILFVIIGVWCTRLF